MVKDIPIPKTLCEIIAQFRALSFIFDKKLLIENPIQ